MNLSDLYEMVQSDLNIDKTELDTESLKTPQLHNKYLIMHSQEKLKLEQLFSERKIKRRDKWLYYTGYLESVVKVISNRQWNIRAALDWIKFTQGA